MKFLSPCIPRSCLARDGPGSRATMVSESSNGGDSGQFPAFVEVQRDLMERKGKNLSAVEPDRRYKINLEGRETLEQKSIPKKGNKLFSFSRKAVRPKKSFRTNASPIRFKEATVLSQRLSRRIYDGKFTLDTTSLEKKLAENKFTKPEIVIMSELIKNHLATNNEPLNQVYLSKYLEHFFNRLENTNNYIDFGYAVADQNCDMSISRQELQNMLKFSVGGNLENILGLKNGQKALTEFLGNRGTVAKLEFYLCMREIFVDPYVSASKFEYIVEKYIAEGSPCELDVSTSEKNRLVHGLKVCREKEMEEMKTEVFREVAIEVTEMLRGDLDSFADEMSKGTNFVDCLLFDSSQKQSFSATDFKQIVQQNRSIDYFLKDVHQLFDKAQEVSRQIR